MKYLRLFESTFNPVSNAIHDEINSEFIGFITWLKLNRTKEEYKEKIGFDIDKLHAKLKIQKLWINQGLCDLFADYIIQKSKTPKAKVYGDPLYHVGIEYNNKVFDLEFPDGCDKQTWTTYVMAEFESITLEKINEQPKDGDWFISSEYKLGRIQRKLGNGYFVEIDGISGGYIGLDDPIYWSENKDEIEKLLTQKRFDL